MNIAVNTRLLLKDKLEGIGWFSYEVLSRLVKAHPEHQFFFIFDRPFAPEFIFAPNVTPIVVGPQARHPILYKIWFDYQLPRIFKKHNITVFLSPDGFLSQRTDIPQFPVIHDLNFEHYPADMPKKDSTYYLKNMPLFAKKAAHIFTVSNFSKNDIHTKYNIPLEKITVTYNAVSDAFQPISIAQTQDVEERYAKKSPYFVYVGALHKRKNIERMLLAFDAFKLTVATDVKLVIVGAKLFKDDTIEKVYQTLANKSDVVFTGRLPKAALVAVIAGARALVYVSYFEGFGMPILEAMKCGVPVITSNVTSMPEIAGDAALLVNPFDVPAITEAMQQVLETYLARSINSSRKQTQFRI